ncbi:MAG: hypothetical protein UT90_C0003G0032 [Parcubacteria group bacterium GW2011_GWA1_40_21]|nr:MAG: hypothetical protein UT80_C0026G0001 [Parcubacteria group bacterium GW2011_GWC1_40_13]KKR53984.1 MAG: hypothetical protein UT90_C0003G0032 [Parcubacteria group bacterium GW2011_GWA1_40_21]
MLTIIFILSLFSIAAIISWKMIEEKKSKMFFFSNLRKCADEAVEKTVNGAKNRFSVLNKKNAKLFVAFAGNSILNGVSSVKRKTYLKKLKFLDSLMAGGNLKKKGSASFFLKNVSEYKGKYTK